MHPRNRHGTRYDFAALIQACPELATFVCASPTGEQSVDFANPAAVTALNRALLTHHYSIAGWRIPPGYLSPPVPGRADYLHHLADLLAPPGRIVATGKSIAILDIGTGANCIYPLLGAAEYGWRFVGTDIDSAALGAAQANLDANPALAKLIELRLQDSPSAIFSGIAKPGETFAASMCNPPFHASAAEAAAGTRRKRRNLAGVAELNPLRNFGGQSHELWCAGGEAAFVRRMIRESAERPALCRWFTTLVSKQETLPLVYALLRGARARDVRTIGMAQGQKKSRIVAWTFQTPEAT